jgi:polyphosphate kinase 2 (PPK2 family)
MTIFDRSWYGRVLVERVDELITSDTVKRSFTEINDFERSLVADGTIIVKFWMHISEDEQLARFEERRDDPLKQWKLTDEDWHNRKKRPHYIEAANEMLALTDIEGAPWHVVFGNHKEYARVFVLETLVSGIEKGLERLGIEPPTATKGDYLG